MKREIKFRAFDKRFKKMSFGGGDLLLRINETDFSEPMQFTGLHDKNGKEIYEGDIVSKAGAFIRWSERLACWAFDFKDAEGKDEEVPVFYEKDRWNRDWEVIGNIYENPKLLTPQL